MARTRLPLIRPVHFDSVLPRRFPRANGNVRRARPHVSPPRKPHAASAGNEAPVQAGCYKAVAESAVMSPKKVSCAELQVLAALAHQQAL